MTSRDEPPASPAIHAMLGGVVVVWGLNFLVMKAAVGHADPRAFNAGRFAMAFAFALAWSAAARRIRRRGAVPSATVARRWWLAAIGTGIVGNVLYQTLLLYGVAGTSPGKAAVLLATAPLFVALLHRCAGGRSGRATWIGFVVAFAGTAVLVAAGAGGFDPTAAAGGGELRGDLLMLAAAVAWAGYIVLSRPVLGRVPVEAFHRLTMGVGAAGLAIVALPSLVADGVRPLGEPVVVRAMLYAGVLSIGLGFLCWSTGIRRLGSVRAAGYQYLVPVVALVGETLWGPDRPPGPLEWAGAAAILAGVFIAARDRPTSKE